MADARHVLITGGSGQVGGALAALDWPQGVRVHAPLRRGLNLADDASIRAAFGREAWAGVINAGAWTAVDRAEAEPEAAFAVNAEGPGVLAELAAAAGAAMVQVSTDHVFAGDKGAPYVEDDPTGPVNVYGASKRAGEAAVLEAHPGAIVVRTGWVVSATGSNFVRTMLRLAGEGSPVRVVDDQFGAPTAAADLAGALQAGLLRAMDDAERGGVLHYASAGRASWADVAVAVMAESARLGGPSVPVARIGTEDWPAPARRPAEVVLDCGRIRREHGIEPPPWRAAVAGVVADILKDAGR